MPDETLWRNVIAIHEAKGRTRKDALRLVILEWLGKGDIEPLITCATELDDPVIEVIAMMLRKDPALPVHLDPVRPAHAPPKAGMAWRDWMMFTIYNQHRKAGLSAEAALRATADAFTGVDVSSVKSAITRHKAVIASASR